MFPSSLRITFMLSISSIFSKFRIEFVDDSDKTFAALELLIVAYMTWVTVSVKVKYKVKLSRYSWLYSSQRVIRQALFLIQNKFTQQSCSNTTKEVILSCWKYFSLGLQVRVWEGKAKSR